MNNEFSPSVIGENETSTSFQRDYSNTFREIKNYGLPLHVCGLPIFGNEGVGDKSFKKLGT